MKPRNSGCKPGSIQSKNMNPIYSTDDPRYLHLAKKRDEYNAWQKENKKRREDYQRQLA